MIKLHKYGSAERCDVTREIVHNELEGYCSRTQLVSNRDSYWIAPLAPVRYSMLLPFSRIDFVYDDVMEGCQLEARFSSHLAVPFFIFAFAIIVFSLMGPMTLGAIVAVLLIPTTLVSIAVLDCSRRLKQWWEHI